MLVFSNNFLVQQSSVEEKIKMRIFSVFFGSAKEKIKVLIFFSIFWRNRAQWRKSNACQTKYVEPLFPSYIAPTITSITLFVFLYLLFSFLICIFVICYFYLYFSREMHVKVTSTPKITSNSLFVKSIVFPV